MYKELPKIGGTLNNKWHIWIMEYTRRIKRILQYYNVPTYKAKIVQNTMKALGWKFIYILFIKYFCKLYLSYIRAEKLRPSARCSVTKQRFWWKSNPRPARYPQTMRALIRLEVATLSAKLSRHFSTTISFHELDTLWLSSKSIPTRKLKIEWQKNFIGVESKSWSCYSLIGRYKYVAQSSAQIYETKRNKDKYFFNDFLWANF